MIDRLNIQRFRGIKGLSIDALKRFNVIFGENNAGKTSVLESVRLLACGFRFSPILKLARVREMKTLFPSRSNEEFFASFFPFNDPREGLSISAQANQQTFFSDINGSWVSVLSRPRSDRYSGYRVDAPSAPEKTLSITIRTQNGRKECLLSDSSRPFPTEGENFPSVFIASYDHLSTRVLSPFVKDRRLMEHGLNIAKRFDSGIESLFFQEDSSSHQALDSVRLSDGHVLPLSSFGDGLRKTLMFLGGIQKARHGVLLIDEFDDALHEGIYLDVFALLLSAAQEFDVQIIATTHRDDIVKAFAKATDIPQELSEAFSFITLRRSSDAVLARSLSLDEVLTRAERYGFEVRE